MAVRLVPSRGFLYLPRLLSPQYSVGVKTPHIRPALAGPVNGISSSCHLSKDPNTPKKSGDKGPQKNYRRKMAKKVKVKEGWGGSGVQLESLLEGMKIVDHEGERGEEISRVMADMSREGPETSLNVQLGEQVGESSEKASSGVTVGGEPADLMDLLSGMKMTSSQEETDSKTDLSKRRDHTNCQFLDPTAGPRLGLFNHPKPGVTIMPPGKPTYSELDESKKLQALLLLKPWSYYDNLLEDRGTPFPRDFPVDNENYDQGEEAHVGFEDHVLLDHLLEDFPKKGTYLDKYWLDICTEMKKGPVRHFMELVVTGLSKNPHYRAAEKREIINWYKEYFNDFSPEELQEFQQQLSV